VSTYQAGKIVAVGVAGDELALSNQNFERAMGLVDKPGRASWYVTSEMVAIGSTAYFIANDGVHGRELWMSDGTAAGTTMVKDIYPGSDGSSARYLTNVNGTLLFVADGGAGKLGLWKSDGSPAGTGLVTELAEGQGPG
jgi:ELWxxDGT repeat protein